MKEIDSTCYCESAELGSVPVSFQLVFRPNLDRESGEFGPIRNEHYCLIGGKSEVDSPTDFCVGTAVLCTNEKYATIVLNCKQIKISRPSGESDYVCLPLHRLHLTFVGR